MTAGGKTRGIVGLKLGEKGRGLDVTGLLGWDSRVFLGLNFEYFSTYETRQRPE